MTTIVSYNKTERNIKTLVTIADSKISAGNLPMTQECTKAKVLSNYIVSGCGDLLTVGVAFDFCELHPVIPTNLLEFYAYLEQLREFVFKVHGSSKHGSTIVLNTPLGIAEITADVSALSKMDYIAAGSGKMKLITLSESNDGASMEECLRKAVDLDNGSGGSIVTYTLKLTKATEVELPSNTRAMLDKSRTLRTF